MATVLLNRPAHVVRQDRAETEIRELVDLILGGLPESCHPLSVFWHDGFARGESGMYRFQDRWLPFGNYRLEVVCQQAPPPEALERIESAATGRFGYRPITAPLEETLAEDAVAFNVLDLGFTTRERFLARSCDLAALDLVHGSRLLHGEDLRASLQVGLDRIPRFNAYRLLQDRLFEALSLFHLDLWDARRELTLQEKAAYSLAICRLWLDFGMALALCLDIYAPDHATRLRRIEEEGDKISLWFRDWRGLLEGIRVAIEFKKNPKPAALNARAIRHGYFLALESWDKVMRVVQAKMLPYHFGRDYELDKVDYGTNRPRPAMKVFSPGCITRIRLQTPVRRQREQSLAAEVGPSGAGCERLREPSPSWGRVPAEAFHRARSLRPSRLFRLCAAPGLRDHPVGQGSFCMLKQVMNLAAPYRKCAITLTGKNDCSGEGFLYDSLRRLSPEKDRFRKLPGLPKEK
jgi:hypothetical protein